MLTARLTEADIKGRNSRWNKISQETKDLYYREISEHALWKLRATIPGFASSTREYMDAAHEVAKSLFRVDAETVNSMGYRMNLRSQTPGPLAALALARGRLSPA